jgi:hypothetical protein
MNKLQKNSILLCAWAALACTGCSKSQTGTAHPASVPVQPAMKAAPPTPIAQKREELGGKTWNPGWDGDIEKALPPDMLSGVAAHAVKSYCPHFAEEDGADKRAFWAYFFQALSGAEAGLNPTSDVHHTEAEVNKIDQVTKLPIHQEGLLQLTYEDADRYGCAFDWEKDRTLPTKDAARTILDPSTNLGCGIKIMENQIVTLHKPLVVSSSYWSTLHPGTVSYRVFRKQMANVPKACGIGVEKPRHRAATTLQRASATTP